jgi:hypothetical protein
MAKNDTKKTARHKTRTTRNLSSVTGTASYVEPEHKPWYQLCPLDESTIVVVVVATAWSLCAQ